MKFVLHSRPNRHQVGMGGDEAEQGAGKRGSGGNVGWGLKTTRPKIRNKPRIPCALVLEQTKFTRKNQKIILRKNSKAQKDRRRLHGFCG
ncbi:hypothetical protein EBR03_08365 [bacterium]|nr:hypothetical protein [bacterium]